LLGKRRHFFRRVFAEIEHYFIIKNGELYNKRCSLPMGFGDFAGLIGDNFGAGSTENRHLFLLLPESIAKRYFRLQELAIATWGCAQVP